MPSDALLGDDGRVVAPAGLDAVVPLRTEEFAAHLARLDGWGLRPAVEFFVDGAVDAATLPATTDSLALGAALVDVDPASAERGRVLAMDWRWEPARSVIVGSPHPGVVLREGTRYAAVLTTDLRGASGAALEPDETLATLRAGAVPARWRSTAAALADVDVALGDARQVAGIAVLTTEHASAPLLAARTLVDDASIVPLPELAFPDAAVVFVGKQRLDALLGVAALDADGDERWGWSNPSGLAHAHVGAVATGRMTVARFLRDDTGDDSPDDETFDIDPTTGTPRIVDAAQEIPVTFVLPAAPPPAAGWPVAIFGHGLGASRHAVLTFAEPLTRAGYAVVAIDMAGHGSRFDAADETNNLAGALASFTGDSGSPDGFGDTTGTITTFAFLEGFLNMSAVRDSIRQSALDLGRVVRLLRRSDLDLAALGTWGGVAPRIDASHVAYLGESYGTIVGTVFAGIEPDVDLFVLDVPGGGVLDLAAASSPAIGSIVAPYAASLYGIEGRFDRFHPMVALAQAVIDGADPLTLAPHVLGDRLAVGGVPLGPRHVVALEVAHDEAIPNIATTALARALGLELLEPSLGPIESVASTPSPASANVDGQTAILVQYAPATHGANWTSETGTMTYYPDVPRDGDDPFPRLPAPITIANPLHPTLDQVVAILDTHRHGAPVVTSTVAPIADFDGDGVPDADETAAGRDPYDPAR